MPELNGYWPFFLVGLLGSLHCVGMCGPIVLAYTVSSRKSTCKRRFEFVNGLKLHVGYNAGRIIMWMFLGALLATGSGLLTSMARVGQGLTLICGCIVIAIGVLKLGLFRELDWDRIANGRLPEFYRRSFRYLLGHGGMDGKLALGLLNGMLPCGLSYALLVQAAASASPFAGALIMLSFGLGTVPALLFAGFFSSAAGVRIKGAGQRFAAAIVILLGFLLLLRGLGFHFIPFHPLASGHAMHH